MKQPPYKLAFYPCCGGDISEPRRLMTGLVDEIIYCDLRKPRAWNQQSMSKVTPRMSFICGDVKKIIDELPRIDVLFYRRDSGGEGGSGLFILGKQWLGKILQHFPEQGGLIITDGSNSRGGIFRKMIRPDGYTRQQWQYSFRRSCEQPWLAEFGLYIVEVTKPKSGPTPAR